MPFWVIYTLSDGLYYLVFYIVPYRKKVVLNNLKNSFADKSEAEIIKISKAFYRHFCDITVESFKMFHISEDELKKRFIFKNVEVIEQLYSQKRSIILAGGHYNNWEVFAAACQLGLSHKCMALYKPLQNPWFDGKMRRSRSRFGLNMWPIKQAKEMFEQEKNNLTIAIFGMDQSPSNARRCHWVKFLNQDTGVSFGPEKYAKENNSAVVYGRILKVKRGHYAFEAELTTDSPQVEPHGRILESITRSLELDIIKQPEYWLWSHKRWKRKKPDDIQTSPQL
jgi:KDO2-lipid IV(A) lauroyltransferase